jgi:uncharacterized low-complexity protein
MTQITSRKSVATAIGAALLGTLSAADLASAADNPFGLRPLERGYLQVAANETEGKCGGSKDAKEAKCGGDKAMSEGQCGEGKCGAAMGSGPAPGEGKDMPEGKCGEGKCGGTK